MRPTREQWQGNRSAYFVSTQTAQRRALFRNEQWATLLKETIVHYSETSFSLHAYVIMPDHLHLLIVPSETIEKAVQLVKGGFSFRAKKEFSWHFEIWQQSFTDHRIRDEEDWQHHIDYIRQNPIEAGLVIDSRLYNHLAFPNPTFPQGLKPANLIGAPNVRAKARTLQPKARTLQPEARTLQPEARTLQPEARAIHAEARTLHNSPNETHR